jgi:RNA polymerase sigma-70 factor (ECF subfamily)
MGTDEWLAERFEENRRRLHSVAYRMLGSLNEADDAVQEAWLRLGRSDARNIENLEGWLTTVVGRVCLDVLRSRKAHREEPLETHLPDPILSHEGAIGPEDELLLAESVGLALLVVLETLDPAERLAFVLHDMFAVPFNEIASIMGSSSAAARQLASRARRRVQGTAPMPDGDVHRQREVADAFLAASRGGNFDALLAVLDPDVVLRSDSGPLSARLMRGAPIVARQAATFAPLAESLEPVLVNGAAGVVARRAGGQPFSIMAFTVRAGKIVEIEVFRDPVQLERLLG